MKGNYMFNGFIFTEQLLLRRGAAPVFLRGAEVFRLAA